MNLVFPKGHAFHPPPSPQPGEDRCEKCGGTRAEHQPSHLPDKPAERNA